MKTPTPRFAVAAAWPIASMLAAVSLGGLLFPPTYAAESQDMTAQSIGVDWFDLVIVAPWLAICGWFARHGSHRWSVLLAGTYAYTVYTMVIYAFGIHFNALFLLYCATLGVSGYALTALAIALHDRVAPVDRRSARFGGALLIGVGCAFALAWLAEDIPALLRNQPPRSLVETGLFTNPVHVLDYAFVLPALVLSGMWLWRGRAIGYYAAPIALAFLAVMSASIGAMLLVVQVLGGPAALPVTIAMFVVAALSVAVLARGFRIRSLPLAAPSWATDAT